MNNFIRKDLFRSVLCLTVVLLCLVLLPEFSGRSQLSAQTIGVEKTEEGWMVTADGEPFPVYGMVWSFIPIGENYTYNLWGQPDDFIKKMIDIDFSMMRDMGVNVIRVFSIIPPKWVEYIYETYGIYTAVNYLFGRYGMSVDGKWYPQTDYSMPATRETLIQNTVDMVNKFKDVKGIFMFMLGNENNYGLEWQSNLIQDLPTEEQHRAKAEYLYSVFGEAVTEAKKLTDLPVSIVNGDILYLDLVEKYVSNLDILSVNVYRGKVTYNPDNEYSTPFFEEIERVLDKPVVFSEFGSDAYNTITNSEDQYSQAEYLLSQWREIYERSAGKSSTNNAIGGFVFEWMDEWWKKGQEDDLDIHDTEATWINGGYEFDFIPEQWDTHKNMNEEWFGIVAQSPEFYGGFYNEIHQRIPRAAYFMLGEVWQNNMYTMSEEEVAGLFDSVNISSHAARALATGSREDQTTKKFNFHPTLEGGIRGHWSDADDTFQFSYNQTVFLDFYLQPTSWFGATMSARFQYQALDDVFYKTYSYDITRGDAADSFAFEFPGGVDITNKLVAEFYSASFLFKTRFVDVEGYYHNGFTLPGHTDWVAEGDFFGLLPESFDFVGLDKDLSKAPFGVEITTHSNKYAKGLKVYVGPELFSGSRPSLMAKYYREFPLPAGSLKVGLLHEEEIAKKIKVSDQSDKVLGRKSSVLLGYKSPSINNIATLDTDLGLLISGSEKIGSEYVSGNGKEEIKAGDIFGAKARVRVNLNTNPVVSIWQQYLYAGLVAESRGILSRNGSFIINNGSGNKHELMGGLSVYIGDFVLSANYLWRTPIVKPRPDGVAQRDPIDEYVTVNGNRDSLQFEIILDYDMTGATYFHEWNSNDIEDARFAGSLGLFYTAYNGKTDALKFKDANQNDLSWPGGLGRVENLFAVKARVVSNFLPRHKIIGEALIGRTQNTGKPDVPLQISYSAKVIYVYDKFEFSAFMGHNIWGPEDWHREFGFTIPWQVELYGAYHFTQLSITAPIHKIYLQYRYRNLEGIADDAHVGLNPRGTTNDNARSEITLGYNLNF